jgi:CRISPR-associated endoribonuclease Cas6
MQFKLKLIKENGSSALPMNYRYGFFKAVSGLLDQSIAHQPFAALTDFQPAVSKSFTFSNFTFDFYQLHQQEGFIVHQGSEAAVEVRFLVDDEEENWIKKTLLLQRITLGNTSYQISQIETVSPIDFQDVMVYRSLCSISLVNHSPSGNRRFLSPKDKDFHKSLKIDLIKRLLRSHPEVSGLDNLDQYCPEFQFQLLSEPREKGFNIKTNGSFQSVIGYQFDFQLKASPVLHELGFYEGFGLPHAMGLGFVEVIA